MSDVFGFLSKGGWFMLPIALCSVVGLAFFLERLWQLQRAKIVPPRFLDVVGRLLEERRFSDAEALCMQNETTIAAVLASGIRYAGKPRDLIKEVMEETGRREVYFLERFTGALGAIATVSPLLGLLGTVVGMIQMFQRVVADAGAGAVDVGQLANGIWQALITTAAGLIVAIPVFLGYRYILSRIDRYAVEIEDVSLRAMEYLVAETQAPSATTKPLRHDDSPATTTPKAKTDDEAAPDDDPSREEEEGDEEAGKEGDVKEAG